MNAARAQYLLQPQSVYADLIAAALMHTLILQFKTHGAYMFSNLGRAPLQFTLKTNAISTTQRPTVVFYQAIMSIRCRLCSGLTVEALIELAKQEFSGHEFPASAYYQHHNSFHDLEQAANAGCDLCLLIVDCFKGIPWIRGESYQFSSYLWEKPEIELEDSAYDAAKQLTLSDVKLSIGTDHVYLGDGLDKVRSFNTLLVQIGPTELPEESSDYAFPFLTLSLNDPGNGSGPTNDTMSYAKDSRLFCGDRRHQNWTPQDPSGFGLSPSVQNS